MPLFRAHPRDPRDQRCEPSPTAAVQLDEVIYRQTRTRHCLSLVAAQLPALSALDLQGRVRARGVPVRAVLCGDSRSLAGIAECVLPRQQQVTRRRPPPLQARGPE